LTYKSSLLIIASAALFIFTIWSSNDNAILAYGQQEQAAPTTATTGTPSAATVLTVKITSPTKGEEVPPGELTITGTSSDDASSDCTVYTDWNDLKPMQKVTPTGGSGGGEGEGTDDYSSWTFTYSEDYHLITEGVNELTSKISCQNSPSNNITKSYSVNVTGIGTGQGQQQQQGQSPTSEEEGEGETTATESSEITANDDNTPFTLPLPSENPDIDNDSSSESQEGEGRGGVTTNEQDNGNVNPNDDDDDEPTIYWDID
jgi:hypothetical protein